MDVTKAQLKRFLRDHHAFRCLGFADASGCAVFLIVQARSGPVEKAGTTCNC